MVFKRSNKRQESKNEPTVSKDNSVADFRDEKLTILSTMYRDKQSGVIQERHGHIIVQLRKDDKTKNVGVVKLNLVDYLEKTS